MVENPLRTGAGAVTIFQTIVLIWWASSMTVDFQQVQRQVKELGQNAQASLESRQHTREQAQQFLHACAEAYDLLHRKVEQATLYDPNLRCALPVNEPIDGSYRQPELPAQATILAADGSQIAPSRHEEVEYALINTGAIQMKLGSPEPPPISVESVLLYDEKLENLTDALLALARDLSERRLLADLAVGLPPPVITFTDGQMELWLGQAGDREEHGLFQESLLEYKSVLQKLCASQAAAAGYVDRPHARTVVRMLEVATLSEAEMPQVKSHKPFRTMRDLHLFRGLLRPGERSALFEIQSPSAKFYRDELALFFFYLNVGRQGRESLARVEVPRWVVDSPPMLDHLHAVLVQQCRVMGAHPYPYLLHRAHETAVVSLQEKEQVTQMIAHELLGRGIDVEGKSHKQQLKDQATRGKA